MTIGEIIAQYRDEHNLSQRQFAILCGVSNGYISMLERGYNPSTMQPIVPTLVSIKKIAEVMDMDLDALISLADDIPVTLADDDISRYPAPVITEDTVTFPVIGEAAAGFERIAVENWEGDTIEIPSAYLRGRPASDYIVLRVCGDSMYPFYLEGDMVLVLRTPTLDHSGQVGLVRYEGELATLKKVEYVDGEDWLRLIPLNAMYPPRTITGMDLEQCSIIGIPKLLIREIEE